MNVLFIFPLNEPYSTIVNASKIPWKSKLNANKNIKKIDCVYPTGLLSIATYAKKHIPDINIKILDFNVIMNQAAQRMVAGMDGYSFADFMSEAMIAVDGFKPDIIGISTLFCSNYQELGGVSAFLKKRYPDSFTICGGHLVSAVYQRVYKENLAIDAISFGEGEIHFVELVNAILDGKRDEYLAASNAWRTEEKLKIEPGFVPQRKLILDLDEIPRYDFDMLLFPDAYYNSTKYFFVIDTQKEQR